MDVPVDCGPLSGGDGMPLVYFKYNISLSARSLLFRGSGLCHSRQVLDNGRSVGEMVPVKPFGRWHVPSHAPFDHSYCMARTVKHFLAPVCETHKTDPGRPLPQTLDATTSRLSSRGLGQGQAHRCGSMCVCVHLCSSFCVGCRVG